MGSSHLDRAGNTVRFFNLSSAFNTISPTILKNKVESIGSDYLSAARGLHKGLSRPHSFSPSKL